MAPLALLVTPCAHYGHVRYTWRRRNDEVASSIPYMEPRKLIFERILENLVSLPRNLVCDRIFGHQPLFLSVMFSTLGVDY